MDGGHSGFAAIRRSDRTGVTIEKRGPDGTKNYITMCLTRQHTASAHGMVKVGSSSTAAVIISLKNTSSPPRSLVVKPNPQIAKNLPWELSYDAPGERGSDGMNRKKYSGHSSQATGKSFGMGRGGFGMTSEFVDSWRRKILPPNARHADLSGPDVALT